MSENATKTYTLDGLRKMKGRTDWDALRSRGDYKGPQEFEIDWSRAKLVTPETKTPVSIRLDPDVLAFFKGQGRGYQTRINAVLRSYVQAITKQD